MSSIMDKLKKNSKSNFTSILSDSKFFNEKDMVPTDVPMINVALSGSMDGVPKYLLNGFTIANKTHLFSKNNNENVAIAPKLPISI